MSSTTASAVILVVEQTSRLTPPEEAIRNRLSERFKYTVHVQDVASFHPEEGTVLVVVCSRRAPYDLLELAIPALVCSPFALFALGMTTARPKDFGKLNYSSLLVCPDSASHPLAGGLTGRHKITENSAYQGWAKPGSGARVVATVGGDSGKAVVFAYNKGEPMPGCEAPARRVAFLAPGTDDVLLTEQGWMLFEAAAHWAAEGGAEVESEGPAGQWFLKDGAPTRSLSVDEYRAWVHEQVSRQVWKSLITILSFFGIGGLVTLYLAFSSQLGSRVEEGISRRATETEQKLANQLEQRAATKVAELVYETSPVAKDVVKRLKEKAGEIMKEQLNNKDTRDQLADVAIKELYQNGKMTAILLERFQKTRDWSQELRRIILEQLLIYTNEDQIRGMGKVLVGVVVDEREHEDVRKLALEMYQPALASAEASADLKRILERLGNKTLPAPSPALRDAYVAFFSRFSDDHAETLLDWLAGHKGLPSNTNVTAAILTGVVKMPPLDKNVPKSLDLLVRLALGPDPAMQYLGVEGLKRLDRRPTPEISQKPRQRALEKLLKGLNESRELFDKLIPTRTSRGEILIKLLRPEDEPFVQKWVNPGERAKDRLMQVLLYNWVERMQAEKEKVRPLQVIDKVYRVPDALYGEGTVHLLKYALRYGTPGDAAKFLGELPRLYLGPKYAGSNFHGQAVVEAAVAQDVKSFPPFKAILALLEGSGKDLIAKETRSVVRGALNKYSTAPDRQPSELADLQAALESPALKDVRLMRTTLVPALTTAYQHLAARYSATKDWPKVIDTYSRLATLNPADPVYHFDRGKVFFEKVGDYPEALAAFGKAIAMAPNRQEYYAKRADLYVRQAGQAAEAVKGYQEALKLLEKEGNTAGPAQAILHRKLAKAYILLDKQAAAMEQTELATKLSLTPLDKARAQENLGVLYLSEITKEPAKREQLAKRAFDQTEKVRAMYPNLPWNWLVRYLAARELGNEEVARTAYQEWLHLRGGDVLGLLHGFIPELLEKHLGRIKVQNSTLRAGGPRPRGKNEFIHEFTMQRGKKYVIDMVSSVFDSYLIVLDPSGKEVARDDDSGGYPNARITLDATKNGVYRIIATSFEREAQGAYTLIIREPKEPER